MRQETRIDGRVKTPISIVVVKNKLYLLAIPTDGVVEDEYTSSIEVVKEALGKEFLDRVGDRGLEAQHDEKEILPFIQEKARDRKFGLYEGDLTTGILKRINLSSK